MQRHVERKHSKGANNDENTNTSAKETEIPVVNLYSVLTSIGLQYIHSKFLDEKEDLNLILNLSEDDFRRLM